jgi:hypothetical protein
VLRNYFLTASLVAAGSGALIAQAGAGSAAQEPQTQPRAEAQAKAATTTLTGCVYQEKDVPGRAPNVAERAGILEDYILAETTPADRPAGTSGTGTAGATATAGAVSKAMYKLEFVDDEKLKALVGKRVEVSGRIDAEAGDSARPPAATPPASTTDKVIGRDRVNLAALKVVSIKEVAGTCPAKPAGGQ